MEEDSNSNTAEDNSEENIEDSLGEKEEDIKMEETTEIIDLVKNGHHDENDNDNDNSTASNSISTIDIVTENENGNSQNSVSEEDSKEIEILYPGEKKKTPIFHDDYPDFPAEEEGGGMKEPENYKIELDELECHLKWLSKIDRNVFEGIENSLGNFMEMYSADSTFPADIKGEFYATKMISLNCIKAVQYAMQGFYEEAFFVLEETDDKMYPFMEMSPYDDKGYRYLFDSLGAYVKYSIAKESSNANAARENKTEKIEIEPECLLPIKMAKYLKQNSYEKLSPNAKCFVLATKLEFFNLIYQPLEECKKIVEEMIDLDPDFFEWKILYCQTMKNYRHSNEAKNRHLISPTKRELEEIDKAYKLSPDNFLVILTACEILIDYMASGLPESFLEIGGWSLDTREEIVSFVKNNLKTLYKEFPKSRRIKLIMEKFFRSSILKRGERNVLVANGILDELMEMYPRTSDVLMRNGLLLVGSQKKEERETGMDYLEEAIQLEPFNSKRTLKYCRYLVGKLDGDINVSNFLKKKLILAQDQSWSLFARLHLIFLSSCVYLINENDEEKNKALGEWIYGFEYAKANDDSDGKNKFLDQFWYLTRTQVKKYNWPSEKLGRGGVLNFIEELDSSAINEDLAKIFPSIKEELEEMEKMSQDMRESQSCPDKITCVSEVEKYSLCSYDFIPNKKAKRVKVK